MPPVGSGITPFQLAVPEAELDDLRTRLRRTRWPERETVDDWSQGIPLAYLQELCAYWCDGYDWRALEARLNAAGQFRTDIDGLGIHFLHVRSPHPGALPLLLTHGWPGSVVEFLKALGPLTDPTAHGGDGADAFDVVCPSLPGYGFSAKPETAGWDIARTADAWDALMAELGYEHYFAQGGDWGSAVTTALAERHPDRVSGIHVNFLAVGPGRGGGDDLTEFERESLADLARHNEWGTGYSLEQATR